MKIINNIDKTKLTSKLLADVEILETNLKEATFSDVCILNTKNFQRKLYFEFINDNDKSKIIIKHIKHLSAFSNINVLKFEFEQAHWVN